MPGTNAARSPGSLELAQVGPGEAESPGEVVALDEQLIGLHPADGVAQASMARRATARTPSGRHVAALRPGRGNVNPPRGP